MINADKLSNDIVETTPVRAASDIGHPDLVRAWRKWCDASGREGHVPTKTQMQLPHSLAFAASRLVFFELTHEPERRYFYRVIGEDVIRDMGANYSGRFLDEVMHGRFFDRIRELNDVTVEKAQAVYSLFKGPWRSIRQYHRLALPLASEDCHGRPRGPEDITHLLVLPILSYESDNHASYEEETQGR